MKKFRHRIVTIVGIVVGLMVQVDARASPTTEPPAGYQPKEPNYVTAKPSAALAIAAVDTSPVIRVYQDSIPWFGQGRDQATLLALGLVLGDNYFVHPLSDLSTGIPADTTVVLITSNGEGLGSAAVAENDAAAQANLDTFVQAGGTLIVDMGDNLDPGGFIAPGASGTPDLIFPLLDDPTLAPNALGADEILGTADDHPIVKGPDGIPGTGDDLNDFNIGCCFVAHGNLADGITLPVDATVLMTATFDGVQKPILAEYPYGSGRIILDTLTKESSTSQPVGFGPSFFLLNLLHDTLQLPPPTPPANDDFDFATGISGLPFVDDGTSTLFATTAADDPLPLCFGGANSTVWYQFTPTPGHRDHSQHLRKQI